MPLLFFFPYIIWMGMIELAQEEMRVPVTVHRVGDRPPGTRLHLRQLHRQ